MKLSVVETTKLPGLSELLSIPDRGSKDDTLKDKAKEKLKEQGRFELKEQGRFEQFQGPVEEGREDFDTIADAILHGTLVETMEDIVRPLPWLEVHVPPGGNAAMNVASGGARECSLELTLFGSGLGVGSKMKLMVEQASDERMDCAKYLLEIKVRPKLYRLRDERVVVLDVVGFAGEAVKRFSPCPFCGIETSNIDLENNTLGPWVDYSDDDPKNIHTHKYSIERAHEIGISLGFSIPQLKDVNVAIGAKLSTTMTWEVTYKFIGGQKYQPYKRKDNIPPHSPMWAIG